MRFPSAETMLFCCLNATTARSAAAVCSAQLLQTLLQPRGSGLIGLALCFLLIVDVGSGDCVGNLR